MVVCDRVSEWREAYVGRKAHRTPCKSTIIINTRHMWPCNGAHIIQEGLLQYRTMLVMCVVAQVAVTHIHL